MIGSKIRREGLVPDSSRMSKRSEGSSKSSYLVSSTCAFLCLSPFRGMVQLIVVMWRQSEFTDSDPLFFFHWHRVINVGFSDRGEPAQTKQKIKKPKRWIVWVEIKPKQRWTLGAGLCRGIPSHLQPRARWGQPGWDSGKDGLSWSHWPDTPTRNPTALPRRTGGFHHLRGSWPQDSGARWPPPGDTTPDIL